MLSVSLFSCLDFYFSLPYECKNSLSGFGPITLMKRPVRIRTQGVMGWGRKIPGYPIGQILQRAS
jgi:hypothetical protein